MFCFLEILPPIPGRRAARKERRVKPICYASLYNGSGKNQIYKITVQKRQDGREFEGFCTRFAGLRRKLLAPQNAALPQEVADMLYHSACYRKDWQMRSAVDLISSAFFGSTKKQLAVVDLGGKYAHKIEPFAQIAGRIDVLTLNSDSYENTRDKLYRDYGLAISVTGQADRLGSADAVLALDADGMKNLHVRRLVAFDAAAFPEALQPARIRIPVDFCIPPELDPIDFAGALAELNGNEAMHRLCATGYQFRGKVISRAAAIEYMTITHANL